MFPEDIIEINAAIVEIIYQLNKINGNITERLKCLLDDVDADEVEEQNLLHDSQILRKYIPTLKKIEEDCRTAVSEFSLVSDSVVDKLDLYLCYDNICPLCNWKMQEETLEYTKIRMNGNIKRKITTQKCTCCHRNFVIEDDLKEIDIEYTNINVHEEYFIREELNFMDVIVLTTVASCMSSGHNVTDITAKIPIIEKDGSWSYITKNIAYCRNCNRYIMLKSDFADISNVVACQVIDQTIVRAADESGDDIDICQRQSILYQYGYNVKAKENLSDKQRHLILALVVEAGILTRVQISSHLDTLIERGSKIPNWAEATSKWKQDRDYVTKYKPENLPSVMINKLILKYSKNPNKHPLKSN